MADPSNRPPEQVARALGPLWLAEPQRVQHRNRPRAHGEDVAQNPPHAGRRPLEGLDCAGMVVGLDLEGEREAASHIDRTGVLSGLQQQLWTAGRQAPEQLARVLVRAVL